MRASATKETENTKAILPVKMTRSLLNQYQGSLMDQGLEKKTIRLYCGYLERLYDFLPGEKELTDDNIQMWIQSLKKKGYSERTINLHISSLNGLLKFCGQKARLSVIATPRSPEAQVLTRDEYLQLLSYVKKHGSERDYLFIKILATLDISMADLSLLTVEACRQGRIGWSHHREIMIPASLQQELLAYIDQQDLNEGPVLVTSQGHQPDRSNMTHRIEQYAQAAGVDPKKCSPRALHNLV